MTSTEERPTVLLTQVEVANRLNKSVKTVARLRSLGLLAYIPGRPVLIPDYELERYIRSETRRKEAQRAEREAARRVRPLSPRQKARKMLAEALARGAQISPYRPRS